MSNAIVTEKIQNGNGSRVTDAFRRAFGLADPPPTPERLLRQVNELDKELAAVAARLDAASRNVTLHRRKLAEHRQWLKCLGGDE